MNALHAYPILAEDTAQGPSLFQALIPFILIFFVFYILIILPQNKRRRRRMEMLSAVRKGDRVITTGGIHGLVTLVRDNDVVVKVDDDVKITFQKSGIAHVLGGEGDVPSES
jgi:preprotein translocase subunit YajC